MSTEIESHLGHWEVRPTGGEGILPPVRLHCRAQGRSPMRLQDYLTPDAARTLAAELIRQADEAEGIPAAEVALCVAAFAATPDPDEAYQ